MKKVSGGKLSEGPMKGLSIPELERLIEEVCRNGKRFPEKDITLRMALVDRRFLTDKGKPNNTVTWTHDVIGIGVKFEYTVGKTKESSTFKLSGAEWALTFKGTIKSSISDLFINENPTLEIKMGPLRVQSPAMLGIPKGPAMPDTIICEKVRRRGNMDRYLHEMSLIRLYL